MFIFSKSTNTKGFTLSELLVVIAIFVMIAALALANLRGASPKQELNQQAENLASVFRQAQVQSYSGTSFNGVIPTGGFGVHIAECQKAPCSVSLFADLDGDFDFDERTELVATVSLGTNITIAGISESSPLNVIYKPPRPIICYNNVCSDLSPLKIVLGHRQSNLLVGLFINPISGQISVN